MLDILYKKKDWFQERAFQFRHLSKAFLHLGGRFDADNCKVIIDLYF